MRSSSPAGIPVSTVVKYGDFDFSASPANLPVPFVTMEQEMLNDHNGRWGRKDVITINGTITGEQFSGLQSGSDLQSGLSIVSGQKHIISGFSKDFQTLTITDTGIWAEHPAGGAAGGATDSQPVYLGKNCIIRSISFDEGRYYGMLNYSINLEAYEDAYAPTEGVLDPVNQYSFAENEEEETITISHTISARGIYQQGNGDPLTAAKDFVHDFTGYNGIDPGFITTGTDFCPVLKTQSETIDRASATYSITETYEAEATGCATCIAKYSSTIDSGIADDFVKGSINGTVDCGKTGTLGDARSYFETLDIHDIISADTSYSDFFEIPLTFNAQEIIGGRGNERITFSATYDNNNTLKAGTQDFVYINNLAYYAYNVDVNYDEISEVASASIKGSINSRGNLQQKIKNVNEFLDNVLCSGDNGTGLLRDLTRSIYTGLTGSDYLDIKGHDLNLYPSTISAVSGQGNGTASVSATYDNSDKIQTTEVRDSSYNINVKPGMEVFKPKASVNEDGTYGVYKTNVYGREEVNVNATVLSDHRSDTSIKNDNVESSGNYLVTGLKDKYVTGTEVRMESENINRGEVDGTVNLTYSFSDNTAGIIPAGSVYKEVGYNEST